MWFLHPLISTVQGAATWRLSPAQSGFENRFDRLVEVSQAGRC